MMLQELFAAQLAAYEAASSMEFDWRPVLMRAVLDVSPPSVIRNAMAAVNPEFSKSDSTIRRMVDETRRQMGLPKKPVSERGGRTPASFYDDYRRTYCAEWIRQNGGLPRMRQLTDPGWDLKPFLAEAGTQSNSLVVRAPSKSVSEVPKKPVANLEKCGEEHTDGWRNAEGGTPTDKRVSRQLELKSQIAALQLDAHYKKAYISLHTELYRIARRSEPGISTLAALEKKAEENLAKAVAAGVGAPG